jgi:tetratricopeptide (TPR) repeat protein
MALERLDIALSLAQLDIARARSLGDMRFLGYAEATLDPWLRRQPPSPQALILHATILQSRHAFDASLVELDRALAARPDDPQAWLTRATVLRVLGRYPEALNSCQHLAKFAEAAVTKLCIESLRGLSGHLNDAYAALAAASPSLVSPQVRAWRLSELGEMAERRGDDKLADKWFSDGLALAPDDLYMRAARADVLLRQNRAPEVLLLLKGFETSEPMLLRVALAYRALHDNAEETAEATLANAFELEAQRGDEVHRREQARFLLDVKANPSQALDTALQNWRTQREPEDLLILCRAAAAAHRPEAATPAVQFLQTNHLEDARLTTLGIGR